MSKDIVKQCGIQRGFLYESCAICYKKFYKEHNDPFRVITKKVILSTKMKNCKRQNIGSYRPVADLGADFIDIINREYQLIDLRN